MSKYYDFTAEVNEKEGTKIITLGEILYKKLENSRHILNTSVKMFNNIKRELDKLPKDGEHSILRHEYKTRLKDHYYMCKYNKSYYKAVREIYDKYIKFTKYTKESDDTVLKALEGLSEVRGSPKERYYDNE